MAPEIGTLDLTLAVPSIEEALVWYERVLGWRGVCHAHNADGYCLFASLMWQDEGKACINLSRYAGSDAYSNTATHFYALLHVADVDAVYVQVRAAGWETLSAPQTELWGGRSFDLLDLNGFRLMFVQWVEELEDEEVQRRFDAS